MNITEEKIIGEMVAEDYRTAAVFQSFGIDFCCKGNRTINEVCENKNIAPGVLIAGLNNATRQQEKKAPDYQSWPLDLLADYIEKKHHRYVAEKTPLLKQYLDKICEVHGKNHPELFEISSQFNASAAELALHMKKEEQVLFPYIRQMVEARLSKEQIDQPGVGFIEHVIEIMMQEHDTEGERFRHIESLSNNYTPPVDACNTYKVTFALLKEFEDDLHLHIHLENNLLFPKAIAMERTLPDYV